MCLQTNKVKNEWKKDYLPGGESNPGLPRDRWRKTCEKNLGDIFMSPSEDRTQVQKSGRWALYHCATTVVDQYT